MNTATRTSGNSAARATELRQGLTDALATADAGATQTVLNLKLVHQARLSQLTRIAATLKSQYGATDPGVVAAEAAVTASTARVARIAVVHQELSSVPPQVTSTGWALRGQVIDNAQNGVSQLTVFLVDAQKTYQKQYGFAYTDDSGSFVINYAGPADAQQGSGQGTSTSVPDLYVSIASKTGQPLFLPPEVFQPAAGSSTYRTIQLPDGEQPLGDLPPAVRDVAMPSRKTKKQARPESEEKE